MNKDIWTNGVNVPLNEKGDRMLYLSPAQITYVFRQIKIQDARNIFQLQRELLADYPDVSLTDQEFERCYDNLQERLSCDSGDAEYEAAEDALITARRENGKKIFEKYLNYAQEKYPHVVPGPAVFEAVSKEYGCMEQKDEKKAVDRALCRLINPDLIFDEE